MTNFQTEFLETWIQSSRYIGAGLAIIGLTDVGAGVCVVFGSFVLALCVASKLETVLFKFAVLGFALSETVGLSLSRYINKVYKSLSYRFQIMIFNLFDQRTFETLGPAGLYALIIRSKGLIKILSMGCTYTNAFRLIGLIISLYLHLRNPIINFQKFSLRFFGLILILVLFLLFFFEDTKNFWFWDVLNNGIIGMIIILIALLLTYIIIYFKNHKFTKMFFISVNIGIYFSAFLVTYYIIRRAYKFTANTDVPKVLIIYLLVLWVLLLSYSFWRKKMTFYVEMGTDFENQNKIRYEFYIFILFVHNITRVHFGKVPLYPIIIFVHYLILMFITFHYSYFLFLNAVATMLPAQLFAYVGTTMLIRNYYKTTIIISDLDRSRFQERLEGSLAYYILRIIGAEREPDQGGSNNGKGPSSNPKGGSWRPRMPFRLNMLSNLPLVERIVIGLSVVSLGAMAGFQHQNITEMNKQEYTRGRDRIADEQFEYMNGRDRIAKERYEQNRIHREAKDRQHQQETAQKEKNKGK